MKADKNRKSGFYWVRFEGKLVVAEYTAARLGCCPEGPRWEIPGVGGFFRNREVCEVLYGPIPTPNDLTEARAALATVSPQSAHAGKSQPGETAEASVENDLPYCEYCCSWHPIPRDEAHKAALQCFAPPQSAYAGKQQPGETAQSSVKNKRSKGK